MPRKPFREKVARVFPLAPCWSDWYTALVPEAHNSTDYEPRARGHNGSIYSNIRGRFRENYDDGIYELGFSLKGEKIQVVYIGSAHRDGPGSINERIEEYCRNGSHKSALINKAIKDGYTMLVRAKNLRGSKEFVWDSENKYLKEYNYAWNQRNNGNIRRNVPARG
ncbi:uncharacterized protein LOC116300276 [Actinia tenebrosa]|uniref:Uncharacterized protein LOC116300276 n=1 Tax=Actinia tenebrosa TaxID=6105 RepID=A0A6P8IA56_ACTTE|nr:uncharacterized protein LOC116300276 [Actinia tenebrosa]